MTEPVYYLGGEFVSARTASLPLNDLAILRGYGVFDFLRTYQGRPFRLRPHLERLHRSATAIGIEPPWSIEALAEITHETVRRNTFEEATIRLVVTGGVAEDSITPSGAPTLAVMVGAVSPLPAATYEQGVKVITVPFSRTMPEIKSLNYIPGIMALRQARAAQAIEALYMASAGTILEGTTTNFFIVRDNVLITPCDNILKGITRGVVLEVTMGQMEVMERPITLADLSECQEAFITSTTKEILPVVQVDGVRIGNGVPGATTRTLHELFQEATHL
ncbi:MAG: aminotransferase class IV [Ardenticatenales bacterium]|nr:aminotransferase class IV [Ardenticatenales bacterium]